MQHTLKKIEIVFADAGTEASVKAVWQTDDDTPGAGMGRSVRTQAVTGVDVARALGMPAEVFTSGEGAPLLTLLTRFARLVEDFEPTEATVALRLRVVNATTGELLTGAFIEVTNARTEALLWSGAIVPAEDGYADISLPLAVLNRAVVRAPGYLDHTMTIPMSRGHRNLTARLSPA